MESVVIRVKRRRSQVPADLLLFEDVGEVLQKRRKPLVQSLQNLTLEPTQRFAFKRKDFPPNPKVPDPAKGEEKRTKTAAEERFQRKMQFRGLQVIDLQLQEDDGILCNGTPMKVCVKVSPTVVDSEDYVQDEYQYMAEAIDSPDFLTAIIRDPSLFDSPGSYPEKSSSEDSEDSNGENRPENEYPDEENWLEDSSDDEKSESSSEAEEDF